jgi:hypothetical protein
MFKDTLTEQHEPQGKQCIGQCGKLGQQECDQHEARFVTISELAQSPHR